MATASPPHAAIRTTPNPALAIPAHGLKLWHLTSLDAPTVAVAWTLAFAWAANIHLPIWLPVTLALSAWTFYIADRLMDARSAKRPSPLPHSLVPRPCPLRPRHHFHWQHRRIFLPLAIASALAALAIVLHYMPIPARERNSVLAAATLAYFATVHIPGRKRLPSRLKLPKELLVGILFTLACVLPVATRVAATARVPLILPTLAFIALAWLNCEAIESWESEPSRPEQPRPEQPRPEQSRPEQPRTEQSRTGKGSIHRPALALAAISIAAASLSLHHARISLLLATATLSATLLALLDIVARHRPHDPTTLRAAADLALLTPILLYLF